MPRTCGSDFGQRWQTGRANALVGRITGAEVGEKGLLVLRVAVQPFG